MRIRTKFEQMFSELPVGTREQFMVLAREVAQALSCGDKLCTPEQDEDFALCLFRLSERNMAVALPDGFRRKHGISSDSKNTILLITAARAAKEEMKLGRGKGVIASVSRVNALAKEAYRRGELSCKPGKVRFDDYLNLYLLEIVIPQREQNTEKS